MTNHRTQSSVSYVQLVFCPLPAQVLTEKFTHRTSHQLKTTNLKPLKIQKCEHVII
jgi:hypothetical protein